MRWMQNMKVCIVCEGSYPYVTGGVSSWVQMLLTAFQDIEFSILSIATNEKEMSQYKYKIPANVTEINTIYLNSDGNRKRKRKPRLSKRDRECLETFMLNQAEEIQWERTAQFFHKHHNHIYDLVMGKDFYHTCVKLYEREHMNIPISTFLWNQRSMYLPIMTALSNPLPEADVYHSVSAGYAGAFAGMVATIKKKPFILTEHGIYTREREEEIIKSDWVTGTLKEVWIDFFYKLSSIAYQAASKVTTLFEMNKNLQIELGCPEDKIKIIPNGVDYEKFSTLSRRYEKPQPEFNIGVVARVVPIKDIKTMLYAFEYVKEKLEGANLIILGPYDEDKNYYEECLALIKELGIKDVYFHGNVSILEFLPRFDIMLLTSISEGQPLAVLEGMAAGIPQVCTNVGSCKELLFGRKEDNLGRAGLIVPMMKPEDIAQAMVYLSKNPAARKEMGMIGAERVKKYYQKSIFLEQYHDLYLNQL